MPKYKITASKSHKKFSFVLNAENERLAKERIHEKGYSILNVELFDESTINKTLFIFKAKNKIGEIKNGKVAGDDIFKIYLKLRDGVGYEVLALYPKSDEEKDEEYKKRLLKNLEEQYILYKKTYKQKITKQEEKQKKENKKTNIDSFYLKKELENTYKLIDFVLEKTKKLFENQKIKLSEEKREKLKKLYNSLIKIKSSTNIIKLKEVGEKVLVKIGEIELEYLEKTKDQEVGKYLKETNNLLKQIGSNKKFIEKDKDISLLIKDFFDNIVSIFKDDKKKKKKKDSSKKIASYERLKAQLLLNKYKDKLKENNKKILKNIYYFIPFISKFKEKRDELIIERQVIKQNISLFKIKLEKNIFSYTKAKKGMNYFLENIFNFFVFLRNYLFIVVFCYSLLFLIFINLNVFGIFDMQNTLNYRGIFYFIIFILVYFAIYFSRGVITLLINTGILFIVIFFGILNF